jgi:hypothetical protein
VVSAGPQLSIIAKPLKPAAVELIAPTCANRIMIGKTRVWRSRSSCLRRPRRAHSGDRVTGTSGPGPMRLVRVFLSFRRQNVGNRLIKHAHTPSLPLEMKLRVHLCGPGAVLQCCAVLSVSRASLVSAASTSLPTTRDVASRRPTCAYH